MIASSKGKTLPRAAVKTFYDRFGVKQDAQRFYEDPAIADLIAHSAFGTAKRVFEFGCGTGRLAEELLAKHLPHDATYEGVDVSSTMIELARQRLARFGSRAKVTQIDGVDPFAVVSPGVDRIITTYVLDLLPHDEIARFIDLSPDILKQDGRLCIASLTFGITPLSQLVSAGWQLLFRIAPRIVGGCRPIRLAGYFSLSWQIEHRATLSSFGITSEVIVAVGGSTDLRKDFGRRDPRRNSAATNRLADSRSAKLCVAS